MRDVLVSIILLTKNAGNTFESTLKSIFNQNIDIKYEVIAVDSGSVDGTLTILKKYNVKTYCIKPEDFNFGLTRNYGFSLSSGSILVTLSQDALPSDSQWLSNIIKPFFEDDNVVAVQGNTKILENSDVFYWEKIGLFYFTSETKNWVIKYKSGLSFVNCAIRKNFWEKNQIGFVQFSEDKVFQKIIQKSGKIIFQENNAVCYHGHQYSLKSLISRLKNEGTGWMYAGVHYGISDCMKDIYDNRWLLRTTASALKNGEIRSIQELLFPILRPIFVFIGNKKTIRKNVESSI